MSKKTSDLVGKKFGQLTVGGRVGGTAKSDNWACICVCRPAHMLVVSGDNLRNGLTTCCAKCLADEEQKDYTSSLTAEQRINIYKEEIETIENNEVRELIKICVAKAPDYFFNPTLVEKTKLTLTLASKEKKIQLLAITEDNKKIDIAQDIIVGALILKDVRQYGFKVNANLTLETVANHPKMAIQFMEHYFGKVGGVIKDDSIYNMFEMIIDKIQEAILYHHVTETEGKRKVPTTIVNKFVHLCTLKAERGGTNNE